VESDISIWANGDFSIWRLQRKFTVSIVMEYLPRQVPLFPIVLQKSKVASVRIFGETLKRGAIDDSNNLSRVTEVAYEFGVRR